uniref:V-type ATP synthase subunit A n=1 Tax=Ndongobacter massiliensis TaxID=1871025 RepID=UPI000930E30B|nr:V-type ATP synthase subunit A [Ndongobacter massiliensis]
MKEREQKRAVGTVFGINGPVVTGVDMSGFAVREMVLVGQEQRLGEIISLDGTQATIQVYEETEGLLPGAPIFPTGHPLSVRLGPGLLSNMFDGIQRPLERIQAEHGPFLPTGIGLQNLDEEKLWEVSFCVQVGDAVHGGQIFGTTQETELIEHRLLIPPDISGTVVRCAENGAYRIDDVLLVVEKDGVQHEVGMAQEWPVRVPRPVESMEATHELLKTGQRVMDVFFPIAKGGTVAIPGGFGTGKTMLQHQIAKYCDAQIIIYIGCGERGNEMTDVLDSFPKLIDPNSGKDLMSRTVLIANTSNMPVAAREASIYTGITMAEYFRDMGYHVALMADSTSRWAEALREISGRLEEMPAEEGYPAYLSSRIAQFYERAGLAHTKSGRDGSVTLIGAVSPAGGDFSEPVTENTKRYVDVFLGLDKELAYSRHYPAIQWTTSYSGYVASLSDYYEDAVGTDVVALRGKMLDLLLQETKLQEIVSLVGEDVLPDEQRLILEIAKILKVGYLQQNAFHKIDAYVPLKKQVRMLEAIDHLYERAKEVLTLHCPISQAKNEELFHTLTMMKYNIANDDVAGIAKIEAKIDAFYDALTLRYGKEDAQ